MTWLSILGIGEDGVEALSPAAHALLGCAQLVVGGARHLALAQGRITGDSMAWASPLADSIPAILARSGERVVVLASGDPFCFGVGSRLARHVPMAEITCLPAPSAFALACARLGWAWQDTTCLSLCGRALETLAPALQPGAHLLVLSADATTPAAVADYLMAHGFGSSSLYVLEALGGPHERIHAGVPPDVNALNLLAIEVRASPDARIIPLATGLPDALFAHDGQITKREIRAVTLSALAPRQGELLWDIGTGSGSVAIEWLLRHPSCRAIGIEPQAERRARAAANAATLGVPRLELRAGRAPDALAGLPTPDAVFIGGGGRHPGVIAQAWAALRPGGRIVVNAVAIETEAVLIAACLQHGGSLSRIGVERLERIGGVHGFRPGMTVTQWAATKP